MVNDLATSTPPLGGGDDDSMLATLLDRLIVAREAADGNDALQLVVEGLAIGFLADQSPQAKAVVRVLVQGTA